MCGDVGRDSLVSGGRVSVGEAVKDDGGRWAGSPSVCIRGSGMLDRSGDVGTSVSRSVRVAVSSMLIVGARGRVWPRGAGGGGSSGFGVSEDMVAQVLQDKCELQTVHRVSFVRRAFVGNADDDARQLLLTRYCRYVPGSADPVPSGWVGL